MADDELIDDYERDRFAGTSAMQPGTDDDDGGTTADGDARRPPGRRGRLRRLPRGRRDEAVDEDERPARRDRATAPHERTDSPRAYSAGTPVSSSARASSAVSGAEMWKPWANSQPSTFR